METTALLWNNPPAAPVKRSKPLECHKCLDCLTVAFSEESRLEAACGICGGSWEHQGRVDGHGLYEVRQRTACDERCTSASGRKCECKCEGENHGTGAVIEYRAGLGPVPKNASNRDITALRKRVDAWRERCASLRGAILERWPSAGKPKAGYLSQGDYYAWKRGQDFLGALREAKEMKSWHGRDKRLLELNASLAKA